MTFASFFNALDSDIISARAFSRSVNTSVPMGFDQDCRFLFFNLHIIAIYCSFNSFLWIMCLRSGHYCSLVSLSKVSNNRIYFGANQHKLVVSREHFVSTIICRWSSMTNENLGFASLSALERIDRGKFYYIYFSQHSHFAPNWSDGRFREYV